MNTEEKQVARDVSGDYVTTAIPQDERKSSANIFATVAGWIICLSTMLTGGALAMGLDFNSALLATLVGMAILTVISAPLAALGGKFGVSTTMITRPVFGLFGSKIFGLIVAILNGIGWFAFQAAFFALTMQQLFPGSFLDNLVIGSIIGGFFMTLTALYGYKGIAILSFLAVPLIIILSAFGGIAAVEVGGGIGALFAAQPMGDGISISSGIAMVVGNAVLGSIILSDVSRYAKNAKTGAVAASAGYLVGGVFTIICGLAMAYVANVPGVGSTPNLPLVMVTLGLGVGALIILVLAQWTTNTANLYSASLGIGSFLNVPQKYTVAIMGIIGTLMAVFNVYEIFIPFLVAMGTALPPVGGVMLADYYVVHKLVKKEEYSFAPHTTYPQLNWLSVLVVVATAWLTSAPLKNMFMASFMSLVIAFIVYALVASILTKAGVKYTIGSATTK